MARRALSKDMLLAAKEKGWTVAQTARQFEFHHSSVEAACDRHGVDLLYSSYSVNRPTAKVTASVSNAKEPTFSASPEAIARALRKLGKD